MGRVRLGSGASADYALAPLPFACVVVHGVLCSLVAISNAHAVKKNDD